MRAHSCLALRIYRPGTGRAPPRLDQSRNKGLPAVCFLVREHNRGNTILTNNTFHLGEGLLHADLVPLSVMHAPIPNRAVFGQLTSLLCLQSSKRLREMATQPQPKPTVEEIRKMSVRNLVSVRRVGEDYFD